MIAAAIDAALAALAGEDLLALAERVSASYQVKPIARWYASSDALTTAARSQELHAIACLLAIVTRARLTPLAREIALAVVRDPALHGEDYLVLDCLRVLVTLDDEEALRATFPLVTRTWCGAQVGLDDSPCARKAALLASFIEEQQPFSLVTPAPELPPGDKPPILGRHIIDCAASADAATKARLHAVTSHWHAHAATQKARVDAARALVAFGDDAPMWDLADSDVAIYYRAGFAYAVGQRPRDAIARYHALLGESTERARAFQTAIRETRGLAICASHDAAHWIVLRVGVTFGAKAYHFGDSHVDWLERASSRWDRSWTITQRLHLDVALSLPPALAARGVVLIEGTDPDSRRLKLYVFEQPPGTVVTASTVKDARASLDGKPPRPPPIAPPEEPAPAPPEMAQPDEPRGMQIAVVSQDESSHQGKIVVAGQEYVGIHEDGELVFAPPQAVAVELTPERLFSWRMIKRAGASGIGRGDYDWILEIFTWPESSFLACYTVRSRKVIEWCWPLRLRCPKRHRHRIVTFHARSEDYKADVHVVVHPDGTFSETTELATAIALAKDQSIDGAVATHVPASERPPLPPPPRAQPTREEALRAQIRDHTRIIELPGSARGEIALALARRALAHAELSADADARGDLARLTESERARLPEEIRAALAQRFGA